jgi:heat shock protein HslJ
MRRPLTALLLGTTLVTGAACGLLNRTTPCGADVIAACSQVPYTEDPSPPAWPAGQSFTASSILDAGEFIQLVPGTELTMTFRAPYEISAYAGCKTIDVKARLEAKRLVPDVMAVTPLLCLDARDAQDTWIQEFFQDRPQWSFDGPNLMLITDDAKIYLEPTS